MGKPTHSEIREFTALVPDMVALRDWIVSQNCHHAAMESIGIYWMPIYEILEEAFPGGITLLVVNALKLLVIIYTMLKQGTPFDESCFEARRKSCEQKQLSRYIRELEKHGCHVESQA